ncbi:hypothetical protein FB45DRAFT_1004509 [Roridomyces roridus]|uniref:Uncharacterized protein n=1 Tax=Roridomyces roridus TaxID=1738132 RepID=A0AAD7FLE7_9AGAR|nr:hypothetical protein FB45DRAFT_1004509 [Roridomyces roridus]
MAHGIVVCPKDPSALFVFISSEDDLEITYNIAPSLEKKRKTLAPGAFTLKDLLSMVAHSCRSIKKDFLRHSIRATDCRNWRRPLAKKNQRKPRAILRPPFVTCLSFSDDFMARKKDELEKGTTAQDEESLETSFPEGGLRAWTTVAGSFLVQVYTPTHSAYTKVLSGALPTLNVSQYPRLLRQTLLDDVDASAISWIGSVSALLIFAGGLLSERLYDRGYFLLFTLSLFMLSLCKPDQYYQIFLTQALGVGLGVGASLGAVIHPIMLNRTLRGGNLGFGPAVRVSAGFVGGLLLIACILMHPRLPPPQTHLPVRKSVGRFVGDVPYLLAVAALTTFIASFYFPLFYLQLEAVKHASAGAAVLILHACYVKDDSGRGGFCCVVWVLRGNVLHHDHDGFDAQNRGVGLRIGFGFAIVGLGGLVGTFSQLEPLHSEAW